MKNPIIFTSIMLTFLAGFSQTVERRLFDMSSVKISEIKANTILSDFGPAKIGDSIYFTSFRDELMDKSDQVILKKEFYDLYKAAIDDSGNVIGRRQPVKEFLTRYHEGPVSWCAKTGELFITQSNYANPSVKYKAFRNENIKLRIVTAKKLNDQWTEVEEFPFNNSEYSIGHPAINESGDTLLFTSDMPGGYGETDLYRSVRKDGKWGTPVNLGYKINTSGKDEFPFLTGSSYSGRFLIFASAGHNSRGGLDLFYTNLNDPNVELFQFPEPINGVNDDFGMSLPENVEFGYMTSNRPGTGNDDIYKLTFEKYIKYLQEILVLDTRTRKPIPKAMVNFCNKKSEETSKDGLSAFWFEKYSVCDVTASALGYKENHKIIKIGKPAQGKILRDTIFLDMIVNEKITLRNIYYDFDKWDILPESATELERLVSLMKENPEMKVELSSHTDERGTKRYNLKLSQLRAKSAVDYVISKGIGQSRIMGSGYGKSQLIHKTTGGQILTPSQHRENRRTEIYIPGFVRGEPVKQEKGDYSDGKPDAGKGYSSNKAHGSIFDSSEPLRNNRVKDMPVYLILGSFKEKSAASRFIQQLKKEGIEAKILDQAGFNRVGIEFQSVAQAKYALEGIKDIFTGAWILRP